LGGGCFGYASAVFVRWPAGALVAVLVFTTACSDAPGKPAVLPTASTTSSSTPTPTPTARDPRAEVEAFVRAYYAEVNAAAASGNTAALNSYSSLTCGCRRLLEYIRDKWQQGSLRNVDYRIDNLRVSRIDAGNAEIAAKVRIGAYEVLDRSGRVVERVAEESGTDLLELARLGDRWIVQNITSGGFE
jgi:hypothetical protein